MKKIILLSLSLLLAFFACKKQEITFFATPDCVQTQINTAIIVDCAVCLISVVQYEYKN